VSVAFHRVVDDIDRQIVALLRQDARRSFQSIGLRVSLSAPAVKRRVDRLEADGVVRGYTALVDPARFGWQTHAFVALFCEGRMAAAEVRAALEHHPEVEAAYTVAGEASAMVHVRARDTAHLEEALERIRDEPGVIRTQTQIVLSTLFERPFQAAGE
jgi:DNA-binding Lrp family transcriptional regulator